MIMQSGEKWAVRVLDLPKLIIKLKSNGLFSTHQKSNTLPLLIFPISIN